MTKERDQLNATLLQRSNEVTRLQSLSKKTCPDGWRMFSFSCYLLITESGPWKKAREDCSNRGGYLVVINDDDEQKFVFALSDKSPWIGLSELVDGTAVSSELKKFWGHGKPHNSHGSEDCAQIGRNHKTWNDNKCDHSFPWICEKAPV
uniref:C-type lectin domain-containing protein n=1 Tax=Xiphophorus maculatus TaxID=8083 RepID=A0A3B5QZA6_XIPMA